MLVACGVWVLFDSWIAPMLYDLLDSVGMAYLYYNIIGQLPTIIVAGLLIYFGIRLLNRTAPSQSDTAAMPPYPGGNHDDPDQPL